MKILKLLFLYVFILSNQGLLFSLETVAPKTILCLGDSITALESSYRYPLYQKLKAANLPFTFIGPNQSKHAGLILAHAGFSGKNTQYLDEHFDGIYHNFCADIILLHSTHNAFSEDHPIEGIIKAHSSIIAKARGINPNVTIFIAQGITSGKLPKYDYIPALNVALANMVEQLHTNDQPIYLISQADGFDWQIDTVSDKVHPSPQGAEKIASKWAQALTEIFGSSAIHVHE